MKKSLTSAWRRSISSTRKSSQRCGEGYSLRGEAAAAEAMVAAAAAAMVALAAADTAALAVAAEAAASAEAAAEVAATEAAAGAGGEAAAAATGAGAGAAVACRGEAAPGARLEQFPITLTDASRHGPGLTRLTGFCLQRCPGDAPQAYIWWLSESPSLSRNARLRNASVPT
jgi:hypothetical protein